MKKLLKWCVKELPARGIEMYRRAVPAKEATVILMYHGVNKETRHRLIVLPDRFEEQIRYLLETGWTIRNLSDALFRKKPGEKTAVLTFDDGYRDNYEIVFGILEKYGISATIYLTAGYIGTDRVFPWFGEDSGWAVSMDLRQISAMLKAGIEFGSHTISHPLLTRCTEKEALLEIAESRRRLSRYLGPIHHFCYPAGDHDDRIKKMVREAGYRSAVSIFPGETGTKPDLFALPRIEVSGDDDKSVFARKLAGGYVPFHLCLQAFKHLTKPV